MRKILIVGGGYAGFYTAKKLQKHLRRGEAEVTIVDPLPYMTYQPFLPEVAAGSIEPRHAVVAHRRHLKKTKVITAKVTKVDHASKTAEITPAVGEPWTIEYDTVVMTAGAVSRTFPIPGVADQAIGLKTIEEAASIRDRVTANFEKASNLPPGPERDRLLDHVFELADVPGEIVVVHARRLVEEEEHLRERLRQRDVRVGADGIRHDAAIGVFASAVGQRAREITATSATRGAECVAQTFVARRAVRVAGAVDPAIQAVGALGIRRARRPAEAAIDRLARTSGRIIERALRGRTAMKRYGQHTDTTKPPAQTRADHLQTSK